VQSCPSTAEGEPDAKDKTEAEAAQEEIKRIKRQEEDALALALSVPGLPFVLEANVPNRGYAPTVRAPTPDPEQEAAALVASIEAKAQRKALKRIEKEERRARKEARRAERGGKRDRSRSRSDSPRRRRDSDEAAEDRRPARNDEERASRRRSRSRSPPRRRDDDRRRRDDSRERRR
jgi:hypothetical protein